MARPKKKHPGGRPTVMTEEVLRKLEDGFSMGFTDIESSLYAGISSRSLYEYIEKNPEFSQRKEELKQNVKMIAKRNLYGKLKDGDDYNARWYLEKTSEEFNPKQKIDQKLDAVVKIDKIVIEGL